MQHLAAPHRYVLNYKNLKFKTVWVEYPDIESVAKEIGAPPTSTKSQDGTPFYTLPILRDLHNGRVISDSILIADYLDSTYPTTPPVIPVGTYGLFRALDDAITSSFTVAMAPFLVPKVLTKLNPASQPYFRRTREVRFGKKLEDVPPSEETRDQEWKKVDAALVKITAWYKSPEDVYITGNQLSFADMQIGSYILFVKTILGEDSYEWKMLCSGQGGRWKRLIEKLKEFQ